MFTNSKFYSLASIQTLRGDIKLSGSGKECDVIVEPVGADDLVDRLISLCAQPNRTLFSLYANNFKTYQDFFYRVRGGPDCQDVMFDKDGTPLFHFYWSTNPRLVKGADVTHLSSFEMETVTFLSSFKILSTKELLDLQYIYICNSK
jgi:hypothetical protein